MSRAIRRHHRIRLLKNRGHYWGGNAENNGRIVDTPHPCSCWMCRNLRKDYGRSLQELKFEYSCEEMND